MDKQKEIKEMAEIINKRVDTNLGQIHGTKSGFGKRADVTTTVSTKLVAEALVNAGYGDIKQYQEEIIDLTAKLEVAEQDKANLERTIEEMNEVIIIDCDGNVVDNRSKQAVREFAERLKERVNLKPVACGYWDKESIGWEIDELVKEVCGE